MPRGASGSIAAAAPTLRHIANAIGEQNLVTERAVDLQAGLEESLF